MLRAMPEHGARHIHGGVAHADHRDAATQLEAIGIGEIVDAVVHVSERLAGNAQRVRAPHARAGEHGAVAVFEHVVDRDCLADRRVEAEFHAVRLEVSRLEIVEHPLGQAKLGDAVAKHAAYFVVVFEDGHIVAALRQDDRDGKARPAPMIATRMPLGSDRVSGTHDPYRSEIYSSMALKCTGALLRPSTQCPSH